MTDSDRKDLILKHCREIIQSRYEQVKKELNLLQVSANSDTKSSAGDKHETGRAQIMLEKEKLARQLDDIHHHQKVFDSLPPSKKAIVALGSLVITDGGNYLIASALGEINLPNFKCFAISPVAPLAKALQGKKVADSISFQRREILIENIL